jgi:integrase
MKPTNRRPKKLTKDDVASAKPDSKPYRLRDTQVPGLFLRVQPAGTKSWNVAIPGPKRSSVALGKYPEMTLATARTQAHDRLAKKEELAPKKSTFKAFIEGDYKDHVEALNKAGKATIASLKAQWVPFFKARALSSISDIDIARFKADRLKAGISKITVNRDLDRLRAALNVAIEWKLLRTAPVIKHLPVEDSTRVRFLSPTEEKALRTALAAKTTPAYLRALTLLAINTGCRRGELLSLDWSNVDLERKQLRVTSANSKTGRQRFIPLNPEALDVLEQIDGEEGLVFPGKKGRMSHFKRSWATLTKAAKLTDFHFHDLRHHFASRLVQSQIDLYTVGELLGHSGTTMTKRYAHLSDEHKAQAVAKLSIVR